MFLKYTGKGKKKIFKGHRLFKFGLKLNWQTAADTLSVLPFLAKNPLRGSKKTY